MSDSADSKRENNASPSELAPAVAVAAAQPPGTLSTLYQKIAPYELGIVIGLGLVLLLPGLGSLHADRSLGNPLRRGRPAHARGKRLGPSARQNESFRSKPALTFWLIGGGMKLLGVAAHGGYSGETHPLELGLFAVRLPFALFGVFGLTAIWLMLARLVNRRVAWIAVLGAAAPAPSGASSWPGSITDMPMAACMVGAMACFALAVHSGDRP